jgi:hypothetical protein
MHRRAIYDTSQEGEQGKHKAMLDLAQIFIIKNIPHTSLP